MIPGGRLLAVFSGRKKLYGIGKDFCNPAFVSVLILIAADLHAAFHCCQLALAQIIGTVFTQLPPGYDIYKRKRIS